MLGKHYILTGATGSLGESLIRSLNKRGAKVTVIIRNKEKAKKLKQKYKNIVDTYLLDMNDTEQLEMFELNNNVKYDGIINNAGLGYFKSHESHSQKEIEDVYRINLVNLILLLNKVIPHLRRSASIVNISSISSKVTTPYGSHYAASKAGLSHFTNAFRMEREDLHILLVNPGPFQSDFHMKADPTGRFQQLTQNIQIETHALSEQIIKGMIYKKIEINVPRWMDFGLRFYQFAPRIFEKIFKKSFLSKKL